LPIKQTTFLRDFRRNEKRSCHDSRLAGTTSRVRTRDDRAFADNPVFSFDLIFGGRNLQQQA
jgi:hypothetical protein